MPVDSELLEFVVCPKCKGDLKLREQPPGLVCEACSLCYAIEDDIPNMLLEDARPLDTVGE